MQVVATFFSIIWSIATVIGFVTWTADCLDKGRDIKLNIAIWLVIGIVMFMVAGY